MTRPIRLAKALGIVALLTCVGCSADTKDDNLATVSGTVYYNGKPVGGDVNVEYVPAGDQSGAEALTDAEGKYVIPNLKPGTYKIVVIKPEWPAGWDRQKREEEGMDEGQLEAAELPDVDSPRPPPSFKNLLPAKYASPSTTDLSIALNKGDTTKDLKLTD